MAKATAITLTGGTLAAFLTFAVLPIPLALAGMVLVASLTVLADIDIRTRLLPDAITLPLLLAGLALSLAGMGPSPLASALGAALGWLFLAALALFYCRWRGFDGLGLGDAKLLGALGAWTGAYALPIILLIAAVLGLVFYCGIHLRKTGFDRRAELPFGPFLALAGWCVFVATKSDLPAFAPLSSVMQMSQ